MDTDRRTSEQIENQDERLNSLAENFNEFITPKKNPNDLIFEMMKKAMTKKTNERAEDKSTT